MLDRLAHEVSFCAKEVTGILPSELKPRKREQATSASLETGGGGQSSDPSHLNEDVVLVCYEHTHMDTNSDELNSTLRQTEDSQPMEEGVGREKMAERMDDVGEDGCSLVCMPERAALIKSILNFLKKAIPEPTLAENIRTCVCLCG